MRLKDDLDLILINLSNLEGFSPKNSQVDVRKFFKLKRMQLRA